MKKIILVSCLLVTNYTFAESAAKVLFTEKKVTASHNGHVRTLSRGSTLEVGDEIVTSAKSAVHFQYGNGSLVNMGEDSVYKILAYAPEQDLQINAELSRGKLEIQNAGKIKETLKTPIVSLAILGTRLSVYVASPSMTYTQVIEGLVMARGEFIRPGDNVRITINRIESAPYPKAGSVNSPLNTSGKIENESSTTMTTTSSDTQASATTGATSVSLVSNSFVTGTSTTTSTQSVQAAVPMASISLSCN